MRLTQFFEAIAYHGTQHKFGEFKTDHIGTGEGVTSYGWGLYFAQNPDVAKSYWPRDYDLEEEMLKRYQTTERRGDYEALEVWERALMHETPEEIVQQYSSDEYDEYPQIRQKAMVIAKELAELYKASAGNFYKVEIPDEVIQRTLDWDNPLSQQPYVMDALKKAGIQFDPNQTGEQFYSSFESSQEASNTLDSIGITGNRYLDNYSAGGYAMENTSNFVIFNDKNVKVKGVCIHHRPAPARPASFW